MGLSKNHHYLPKSVLRRFCFSGDALFLYDAANSNKGYRQRNIDKAFQSFHSNTIELESGEKSDQVERWLASEVDNPIGHLMDCAERDAAVLAGTSAKRVLAKYLISLLFRAPRARDFFSENSNSIADALGTIFRIAKIFDVDRKIKLFGGGAPKDVARALAVLLPTLIEDRHVDEFMNFQLAFARPAGSEVFCIGDYPFMRYDDPRNALEDVMHEYWVILGPRIAACFLAKTTLELGGTLVSISDSHVRRLNFDFAMRSRYVAANCPIALHQTVRHLGLYPGERDLSPTTPKMFEPDGKFHSRKTTPHAPRQSNP